MQPVVAMITRSEDLKIAPSLLAADFSRLAEEIQYIEDAGADLLHLDVMDGHFVPNLALSPGLIKSLRPLTQLPFDVHLMLTHPQEHIPAFVEAGADRITVHLEVNSTPIFALIDRIKSHGVEVGLALCPPTEVETVSPFLSQVDLVLPMSVNPGFSGQSFQLPALEKMDWLKQKIERDNLSVTIQADGGVNADTVAAVVANGATVLVAGSAIFKSDDYRAAIQELRLGYSPRG